MAVERGYDDIVDAIRDEERGRFRGVTPDAPDYGPTAVWRAFSIGARERALQLLDEQPALIDQPGPDGHTFLYWAAGILHLEVVDGLLARGATVADRDLAFAMSGAAWHGRGIPERIAVGTASCAGRSASGVIFRGLNRRSGRFRGRRISSASS